MVNSLAFGFFFFPQVYFAFAFWKIILLNIEFWICRAYLNILIICPLFSGCTDSKEKYAMPSFLFLFLLRFCVYHCFFSSLIIVCLGLFFFVIILLVFLSRFGGLYIYSFSSDLEIFHQINHLINFSVFTHISVFHFLSLLQCLQVH